MIGNRREIDLLLGDNPFIGVDHFLKSRARERANRLKSDQMIDVITAALDGGAQGYVFSTHPKNLALFEQMKAGKHWRNLTLYAIVPYAYGYVRQATQEGLVGLLTAARPHSWTKQLGTFLRLFVSSISREPVRGGLKEFVDLNLEPYLGSAPVTASLRSVFLHELITDLALGLKLESVLHAFVDHVERRYEVAPGFVTRNFPRFVAFAESVGLPLNRIIVMTPFNKLGFQMSPSRAACEECLYTFPQLRIVAMSIMAAGCLPLGEAGAYLQKLPRQVSVVVGTADPQHARDSFAFLRATLSSQAVQ